MAEPVRRTVGVAVSLWILVGLLVAPAAAATGDDLLDDDLLGEDGVTIGGDDGVAVGTEDGVNASVAGEDVTHGASTDVASDVDSIGGDAAPAASGGDALPTDDAPLPGTGDGVTVTNATGLKVCDLTRITSNKLPAGSLPGLDALPSELAPSGVPTDLLTSEALVGLATGGAPGACEVVDLEDPQVDPTDPPTDPDASLKILRLERTDDDGVAF